MWLSFHATRNELKPHTSKGVGEKDSCVSANINMHI